MNDEKLVKDLASILGIASKSSIKKEDLIYFFKDKRNKINNKRYHILYS